MNNTNNPALGIGVSGMSVSGKAIIGVPTQGRSQADKTRAGHSQLSYSCSAGGASVNLFNGSMIFSRPTISLGANTYAIGASHVYNNSIIGNMPFNTHMGNGWKLDVQQYLFSEGNNQFFYIDSGGTKHIFEPTGLNNHFYDTSGLGLILRLHVNGEHIIEDDYNNRLFFNIQGFLVRVASSHGVTKNYEYINGRLMSIFDSRRTGNNNRIRFAYENDLLATVTASGQTIRFHYNRDNLERIERQVDNLIENVAFFRYAGNQMTRVACPKDFTSLGFTYNNHQRVSLVKEDIVNGIGQGNNFNIGNVVSTLEQNDFAYELSDSRVIRTTVTNRNNIRVAYHFNQKGFTTSVLEVSNNNLNDLRTMEKEPGPILVGPGPDAERINGRNANPIATNHTFIINAGIDGSAIRNYVFNKCRNYRYFNVGFWLKVVSGDIQNSRVRVDVLSMTGNGDSSNTSNHRRYNNEVTFDNTAVGAWQYVSVPIYIAEANLRELRLSFLDNNASRNIKVAEVRLCYDTRSRIVLGTSNEGGAYLDNVTHVAGLPGGNRNITDDFYLTEKDLQSTLYSRFRAEIASPQGTHYFFSHNDGTRKIALTRATNINLMAPSRTLPSVIIHPLILNIDNRTTYFQETISPDGNLVVRGIPHFIRARTGAVSNANNNFNRIELYVRAWRGNTTSNTVSVVDMFGDLRSEVDEYGVRTRYSYDNFGNLSAKEIVAPCAITCASTQHGGACNCNA
ncbi:MAG: hypothetical protein FWE13_06660, partial [Firmicutes bacterium]|nr:hypothetical protein [Bacillota bacterium]